WRRTLPRTPCSHGWQRNRTTASAARPSPGSVRANRQSIAAEAAPTASIPVGAASAATHRTSTGNMHMPEVSTAPAAPDFRSRAFLLGHVADTMRFYHPRCIDPAGGFFHFFRDDGTVYDAATRHLVSSTRFVFNYAMALRAFGDERWRAPVGHGLDYLRRAHRNPDTGGYAWLLRDGVPVDDTNHCYGLAFVALAYAKGIEAGVTEAEAWLDETWELMERHFWEPAHGLYADEADADWRLSPYRGQNANMHACEAWLAAFEATGQRRYLERAALLADRMVQGRAALTGGLVW